MTAPSQPPIPVADDEKLAQVMVYSAGNLFWGDVVVKTIIRINTWLRTNMAPDSIRLFNARALLLTAGPNVKPVPYAELHILTPQILGFHLVPPQKEEVDYDPSEPNRKMEPITALLGPFRIDGFLRMASRSDLSKYIDVNRETFTPIYTAEITNQAMPALGVMRVSQLLVRQANTFFATRTAPNQS